MKYKNYLPYFAGIGFAVIFGFSFMFSKIALEYATALQMIGLRFLTAAVIFILLRTFKIINFDISLKDLKVLIPIAIFQPVIYFLGETYGIDYSSSSMAGIVISLIPVTTAILSYFVLNERMSKVQILFLILSLAGIALISYMALSDFKMNMMLGLLFLFGAVISTSIFNVLSRRASNEYDPVKITFVMMIFAAIVFNSIGIVQSKIQGFSYFAPLLNIQFDISIFFLSVLSSIIAFFLMNYTLAKMPATQFSLFTNLVTVVSIVAGGVFLKEQIFTYQIIGSILIILGVWGVNYFRNNEGKNVDNQVLEITPISAVNIGEVK